MAYSTNIMNTSVSLTREIISFSNGTVEISSYPYDGPSGLSGHIPYFFISNYASSDHLYEFFPLIGVINEVCLDAHVILRRMTLDRPSNVSRSRDAVILGVLPDCILYYSQPAPGSYSTTEKKVRLNKFNHDGTLLNEIIFHEFDPYIRSRLVLFNGFVYYFDKCLLCEIDIKNMKKSGRCWEFKDYELEICDDLFYGDNTETLLHVYVARESPSLISRKTRVLLEMDEREFKIVKRGTSTINYATAGGRLMYYDPDTEELIFQGVVKKYRHDLRKTHKFHNVSFHFN